MNEQTDKERIVMTARFKSLLLCTLSLAIFTAACQSAASQPETIEMKSEEEQRQIVDNFTFDDYKKLFDDAIIEANQFDVEEPLRKWVIRTLAEEKLYYETDLTDAQVIALSTEAMEQDVSWKTVARETYNIHLTLPQLKQWDSEVLVRAQSISVLLKPSDEGVPSPLLRQTI